MAVKVIQRSNAEVLIPEEVSQEIMSGVRTSSVAMQVMRKLPNMSTATGSMPVLSLLPIADFVNGDAGMKATADAAWDKKTITVGEIAVIVPVPQAVLDDSAYDIWGEVQPLIVESFGRVFDRQVFSERNPKAPVDWPEPLVPAAIAAGNVIQRGSQMDIFEDVSHLYGLLEDQMFVPTAALAQQKLRLPLRNARDKNGVPLYQELTGTLPGSIYGVPSAFVAPGTWDATKALAIVGDWQHAVYAIRQDLTFQIFDTGVVSDDDGKVVYNLMQQDMVAMRVVMRLGWQTAHPIHIDRPYGTGYPFAVLTPETTEP